MARINPALLADGTTVENWRTCDWNAMPSSPTEMVETFRKSGLSREDVSLFCFTGLPCKSEDCGLVAPRYGAIEMSGQGNSTCVLCQDARTKNGRDTKENWKSFSREKRHKLIEKEWKRLIDLRAAEDSNDLNDGFVDQDDSIFPSSNEDIFEEETVLVKRRKRNVALAKLVAPHLYVEQEGRCAGCLRTFFLRNLEVDHIIPWSGRGSNAHDNLQLLCPACNSLKGTGTPEKLAERLLEEAQRNDTSNSTEWFAELQARDSLPSWAKKGWAKPRQ